MNLRAMLQCPPNQVEDKDPFFIQVNTNYYKNKKKHWTWLINNNILFLVKLGFRKYGTHIL